MKEKHHLHKGKHDLLQEQQHFHLDEYAEIETKYNDYEFPKVSVILPTFNCAEALSKTIESILSQDYPDLEVVVIDGGSKDRTLEVFQSYRDDRINVYHVTTGQRYAMLNKGISQAKGLYICHLMPGDYYLYNRTLRYMMSLALEHQHPHMVYCGALLRDGRNTPEVLYRPYCNPILKKGMQPTCLQSCWIHVETFKKIGKFSPDFPIRAAFEFFCRFYQDKSLKKASSQRVLIDFLIVNLSRTIVFNYFIESFRIIKKYYGVTSGMKWILFHRGDWTLLLRVWLQRLKVHFQRG